MRRGLLALIVTTAACASSGSTPEVPQRAAPIFTSSETGTLMGSTPHSAVIDVQSPPAAVWLAVKKAYADWGVPLNVENPSTRQIGNSQFARSRQFAGFQMTELVDCGSGPEGAKAASYRIYMSLLTFVLPDNKGGTTVQTTFAPAGQDVTGTSNDRIQCGSTGRLEQAMVDAVKANLGKS